ncbi:hypothetical protein BJ138DRAFT_1004359 [Hygrophoropsis aurantiaca]|uniref:Uncharacterized protein n=1 Tax=Hygrophoropsis aurantiaca TaxID=72124 RepID=A0ACB8AGP7_9AGAM|nr:hypothetical protein BJ138DRAFT_1004359 [Hygrophoropsis aurantiaca]
MILKSEVGHSCFIFAYSKRIIVVTTVIQCIAMLITMFRLWFRLQMRRFWWEDTWALIALLFDIVGLISGWLYFPTCAASCLSKCDACKLAAPGRLLSVSWLVYSVSFTCVVWAVRISILVSIMRIVYMSTSLRHITYGIATLFSLLWGAVVALKLVVWRYPRAFLALAIGSELSSDILSDILLVVLSLRLLWHIKLRKQERRIILIIFSTSLTVSMVSCFHGVCELLHQTSLASVAKDFELAICLIVCNSLVVITFIYRLVNHSDETSTQSFTSRVLQPTTIYFTSIDFDHLSSHPLTHTSTHRRWDPPAFNPLAFTKEKASAGE